MSNGTEKIDYQAFPLAKPTPKVKGPRKRLRSHYKPIPKSVKETVLIEKGDRCFMGFCGRCHGTRVTVNEGQHHFPHKGPHCTPDDPKYLWPAHDVRQEWYHEHPNEERKLFEQIEATGYTVYWRVPGKYEEGQHGGS
jgi:hypothetical protein